MNALLNGWKKQMEKLEELQAWCRAASLELKGVPTSDPRYETLRSVEAAAKRLEEEIGNVEKEQDRVLTGHLQAVGPLTFTIEDGTRRVVAAAEHTAGGAADLLPADILRVWRVASVLRGSIVVGEGGPQRLTFGDAEAIDWFKVKKKGKR